MENTQRFQRLFKQATDQIKMRITKIEKEKDH